MSSSSASSSDEDGESTDTATATTSDNGANTAIVTRDGKTIITKTDGAGHTKTVTIANTEPQYMGYNSHHGWNPGEFWWVGLIALFVVAGVVKTAIRAMAGDTRTARERRADRRAGRAAPDIGIARENELLAQENEKLKAQAIRLEERVAVLERIVTDPAKRVAEEIDALR